MDRGELAGVDRGSSAPVAVLSNAPVYKRRVLGLRFVTCVVVLVGSAVSMEAAAKYFGALFTKKPVPLKKSLAVFDRQKLEPEYSPHIQPVAALPDETVQALGTHDYVTLLAVDNRKEKDDPASTARIFVTYYTGQPDMVPHVPEECYQASGCDLVGQDDLEVSVPGVGANGDRVPVRLMTFEEAKARGNSGLRTLRREKINVIYFFHTNGHYATTRDEVRLAQSSLRDKYAYYSKIEVTFSSYDFSRSASKEETAAAIAPLLRKLMPIILQDHFQDWDKLKTETNLAATGAARG